MGIQDDGQTSITAIHNLGDGGMPTVLLKRNLFQVFFSFIEWVQPFGAHLEPWHLKVLPDLCAKRGGWTQLADYSLFLMEDTHFLSTCQLTLPPLGLEQEAQSLCPWSAKKEDTGLDYIGTAESTMCLMRHINAWITGTGRGEGQGTHTKPKRRGGCYREKQISHILSVKLLQYKLVTLRVKYQAQGQLIGILSLQMSIAKYSS